MLDTLFCLLPTTGYHTHCSYGYSTDSTNNSSCVTIPNWNTTFWSGYNFTICVIFHFFHRSSSLSPYYNEILQDYQYHQHYQHYQAQPFHPILCHQYHLFTGKTLMKGETLYCRKLMKHWKLPSQSPPNQHES